MSTLREYRDSRLEKLNKLLKRGIEPYPAQAQRNTTCADLKDNYTSHRDKRVTVAGRMMSIRSHGQVVFIDIKDATGQIQLVIKRGELKGGKATGSDLKFEDLSLLDAGDFVQAEGKVGKTKREEVSVFVNQVRILTKSLRPQPDAWSGLKEKETRLRRRYLDINSNPDIYERFIRRSRFWQSTRNFLIKEGFTEINVPVLEHTTGGADAKPFSTHMDALDEDFYLRISHELPLKRLVGGGYERVFDIGPRFRNENYSDEHLPEHVAMELYWAYADWRAGMKLVETLINYVAKETFGKQKFEIGTKTIDLSKKWEEEDFTLLMKQHYSIEVGKVKLAQVQKLLTDNKIETSKKDNLARGIDKLWKNIRQTIEGPVFVTGIPKILSPLAKADSNNPALAERFWPIIAGTEMGTGWSELNNPQEQLTRFLEQQKLREAGDEEAQMLDIDYVEMLEYGMPPTFGYGYSERLFWVLEGVSAREGVPFPQLRKEIDNVTKSIYPEVFKFRGKK